MRGVRPLGTNDKPADCGRRFVENRALILGNGETAHEAINVHEPFKVPRVRA